MSRISKEILHLVCHPFGNYAITEMITNWPNKVNQTIFKALKSKLNELSMQKYSSNVIEVCLERSDSQTRSDFIVEISNSDKIANLIKHSFGNYVVQKALKISLGTDHQILASAIRNSMFEVKDKRIRSKWEKILYDCQIEHTFSRF